MIACTGKKTKYQPGVEEFNCPSCGAKSGTFCIDESGECAAGYECETMHDDDYLRCYSCKYDTSGRAFAAAIVKRSSLIDCPHCKGKGKVKKS